jgi:RimJ/RimL family protein N-acetyltransferase
LAVSRFTQFAFDEFELLRIFAVPFTSNYASRRVLVKAGYSLEGTLRRSSIKEGVIHDQALYACVRGAEEY